MTLATDSSTAVYYGTGGAGPFTFNFKFFLNSDITVTRNTAGITTTLISGVDYILTGAGSPAGGAVTLTTALSGGPPAEALTIRRIVPLTQPTSISNQSAYFPQVIEDEFDRLEMQIQQVNDLASQSAINVVTGIAAGIPLITADVSGGTRSIDISGLSAVFVSKDDATANTLNIIDSSGATIEHLAQYRDGLQIIDETVLLVINSTRTNWKRVG